MQQVHLLAVVPLAPARVHPVGPTPGPGPRLGSAFTSYRISVVTRGTGPDLETRFRTRLLDGYQAIHRAS